MSQQPSGMSEPYQPGLAIPEKAAEYRTVWVNQRYVRPLLVYSVREAVAASIPLPALTWGGVDDGGEPVPIGSGEDRCVGSGSGFALAARRNRVRKVYFAENPVTRHPDGRR